MDKEKAVRVISLFSFGQAPVVITPVGVLKVGFEEVTFGDVGSTIRRDGAEFVHAAMHRISLFPALREVGLVHGNSWIRWALAVGDNGEGKGALHCRIHGSIFCRFDGFRRRTREPLIEVELDFAETGSRKQSISQLFL